MPHKAHFIPDQKWHPLFEALDWLIENRCHTALQRDEACLRIRSIIAEQARCAWQCHSCGRMFIEDTLRDLHCYPPGPPGTASDLFREEVSSGF